MLFYILSNKLIQKEDIDEIDSLKIHAIYDEWPKIAKLYYEKDLKKGNFSAIKHIVFSGMGGSGALGDIFSAILSKTDIHVCVVKGYNLPKTVDPNTLVIPVSISGNTNETLSIMESAYEHGCKIIAFSSGGKMEQLCLEKKIEFRKIEQIHSPRASFPTFLYSMLNVLSTIIPIKKEEIFESIENLVSLQKEISSDNLSKSNIALNLAEWIKDIPLIYYSWGLQSAAIRFKNSLQENAKTHVIIEDILESCHNGIVAWEKKSNIQPILIRGTEDHIKTKEKYEIIKKYFQEKQIDYKEIISVEGNILSKIVSLIYLLDYVTIYKSVLNKTDPSPVKSIDYVKNRIT